MMTKMVNFVFTVSKSAQFGHYFIMSVQGGRGYLVDPSRTKESGCLSKTLKKKINKYY